MKIIAGPRDSGKAKKLCDYASKNNAAVLVDNKKAFSVKAKNYGYDDLKIIEMKDLVENNYDKIVIHNGDKILAAFVCGLSYNTELIGFSATISEDKE